MKKQNQQIDFDSLKRKIGNVEITTGGVLESTGSTSVTKTGGWKSMKPVTDLEKCIGCGICWVFCPEGCIKKNSDNKFIADLEYCKGCGICANECPKKAITMVLEVK